MSRAFEVIVAARAATDFRRLPRPDRQAVTAALELLATEPRAGKPLVGELAGLWSLRRGDYRVLYRIDDEVRRVGIARIAHRRDVYRRR